MGDFQVPISLGTQTGGSTIRPGSYNGIFAFKPTHNAISREGLKMCKSSKSTVYLCQLTPRLYHMRYCWIIRPSNRRPHPSFKRFPAKGRCTSPSRPLGIVRRQVWLCQNARLVESETGSCFRMGTGQRAFSQGWGPGGGRGSACRL